MQNTQTFVVETICPFCKKQSDVLVPEAGWVEYQLGSKPIQRALPMLSADEREKLMTGICEKCFPSEPSEPEY